MIYFFFNLFNFFRKQRVVQISTAFMKKALSKRNKCTILYATETGKSEGFSKSLTQKFSHTFDAKVNFFK